MLKLEWRTERRKVNNLIPYSKNPRAITDTQMEGLKRSLKKFNIAELPAINTDGTLVAGHQRIKALQLLGRGEEIIEVRVPNRKLSNAEFRDYLLTSNRSGGTWDFEKLAADYDLGELLTAGFDSTDLSRLIDDGLEIQDEDFEIDAEIKKAQKTTIKTGDYFALGPNRLLCGDSQDPNVIKKLMAGAKADFIDSDLPFNIGLSYNAGIGGRGKYGGKTNDSKTEKEYHDFVKSIMQNALSVAKPDAHYIFWCDERFVYLFQSLYAELGISSKRLCIWLKNNQSATPQVAFNKITEFAVYGTTGHPYLSDKLKNLNEVMNREVTTGNRLVDDVLDLINIWMVKRLPGNQYDHPTQKPPSLHDKALRRCTSPGDVVLDLTAGSGSLLSATHQLKRVAYMCEIEPVFCQVIINRFKKISNEKIIKLN